MWTQPSLLRSDCSLPSMSSAQHRSSLDRVLKDSGGRDLFAAAAILVNDLVRPADADADQIHSGQTNFLSPATRWAAAL